MTNNNFNRQCNNFDHEGPHADLLPVTLREEYGGVVTLWCDACCERDADMIVPACGNCGRFLTDDDENIFVSEVADGCSGCLYLDKEEI